MGPLPRILAGLLAAGAGAYFGVMVPLALLRDGLPLSAAAHALVTVPAVAFLGLLALAPDLLQRVLSRLTALDLREGGHVGAALVLALMLYLVLGLGALAGGVHAAENVLVGREQPILRPTSTLTLTLALVESLALFTLPVLLYVCLVHRRSPRDALRDLGLRGEDAPMGLLTGFGAALLFILALALLSAILHVAGVQVPENEQALAIARSVTVLGALGIAIASSVGEEVFFRGFLQPRIGLVAQAAVFSLAHLGYVNLLENVVTFALGLLFGLMRSRTGSVWAPIGAHFLFNLLMLLGGIYGDDLARRLNETAPG